MKHSLVKGVLAKKVTEEAEASTSDSQKNQPIINDMFKLPLMPNNLTDETDSYESESEDTSVELSPRKQAKWKGNIHSVDVTCDDFKALPADVRYDILTDLKETRKQNSWGRLHELPQESHQFSNYQMNRLLKRRKVQESLETAEQEMGGKTLTLEELETLMTDQGVDVKRNDKAFRIAADSSTRIIYINDPKSLKTPNENVDSGCDDLSQPGCSTQTTNTMTLSSIPEETKSVLENINEYDLDNEWDSDIEIIDRPVDSPCVKKFFGKTTLKNTMNPALAYMIEHSGLPQDQILALIKQGNKDAHNRSTNDKKSKQKSLITEDLEAELIEIKQEIIESPPQTPPRTPEKAATSEQSFTSPPEKSTVLSSDSDSDDFVEVNDVPILPAVTEKKLEIIIESSQKLNEEDDIFADVFDVEPITYDTSSEFSLSRDNSGQLFEIDKSSTSIEEPQLSERNSSTDTVTAVNNNISVIESSSGDEIEATNQSVTMQTDIPLQKIDEQLPELPERIPEIPPTTITITEAPIFRPKVSERVDSIVSRLETDKEELLAKAGQAEELLSMKSQLEVENQALKKDIGKLERQATEVTEQMREEAQDLLRLFGIPYVVAPQEAEAQCAYLEMIKLTDGTITDDSDIWLFGGRCVYKNFFNNAKRVMQYLANDIEHHFKLTRQQMIQLALLVGSDYTVGVSGIGPVTALEILASFPSEGDDLVRGLTKFSSWLKQGRVVGPGKAALRTKLKNVTIDQGFPNQAVVQAYLFPTVDESKTPLSWGKPNLVLLGDYAREKFGWTKIKFEETMGPVMKKLEEHKSQKNLMSYFKVQTAPKSIEQTLSKRVQKAVQMLGKGDNEENNDVESVEINEGSKKRKKAVRKKNNPTEEDAITADAADTTNDTSAKASQSGKNTEEYIPQREKDRAEALNKKRQAIEVFKKSKKILTKSRKKCTRSARKIVNKEAKLSESSSDSN